MPQSAGMNACSTRWELQLQDQVIASKEIAGEQKFVLDQQSEQPGHHERSGPHHIQVEPCLAQNREPDLAIDDPGNQTGDGKIARGVDAGGQQSRKGAGPSRDMMMALDITDRKSTRLNSSH